VDSNDSSQALNGSVLVVGAYLLNKPNDIEHIVQNLHNSQKWKVVQKWVALGEGDVPQTLSKLTEFQQKDFAPKFALINRLMHDEELKRYEFVVVCDDDITLPDGFLDTYLDLENRFDLSLAQPARTHTSYIDHCFVGQLLGIRGRRTRFVEIGPLFSIRRDIFQEFIPFDEESPMGWGYDFVWPCIIEKMGRRMGIIDATPVEHSMRKPVDNYEYDDSVQTMERFISQRPHLSLLEAFRILESYV
jgi:hypothetical protein